MPWSGAGLLRRKCCQRAGAEGARPAATLTFLRRIAHAAVDSDRLRGHAADDASCGTATRFAGHRTAPSEE